MSTSANFLHKICCQYTDPKNYVDLHLQAHGSAVRTSLDWIIQPVEFECTDDQ